MSYKNPTIPTLVLKGIDKKIQVIQLSMHSLSWLSKSFGLADRIVEYHDGKPHIFPAVFETNVIDPISVMPGDVWNSFSFWVKTYDSEFELNDDFPPKNPILKYKLSCIFYVDIKKISATGNYKETKSKLIDDIFHFFNNVRIDGQLIQKKFIEDDLTEVYKGFTLDQVDNKFKMYPKWACRMDFELNFRDDCYVTNTY